MKSLQIKLNKFFIFGVISVLVLGIFLTVRLSKQSQENRSKASAATSLVLKSNGTQNTPLVKVGQNFPIVIEVNPGVNFVSIIKSHIDFSEELEIVDVIVNSQSFPNILEKNISPDSLSLSVSTGSDVTKVVQTQTKIATVVFHAKKETFDSHALVSINQAKSHAFSLRSEDDPSENVLSNTSMMKIKIIGQSSTSPTQSISIAPTPSPSETCGDGICSQNESQIPNYFCEQDCKVQCVTECINPTDVNQATCLGMNIYYCSANQICGPNKTCLSPKPTLTPTNTPNCSSTYFRPDLCTCSPNVQNQCANYCIADIPNGTNTQSHCCPANQRYCPNSGKCVSTYNECQTAGTALLLSFSLPGIGSFSGGVNNPRNPVRTARVMVYDQNNVKVKDVIGHFSFSGEFYKGIVSLDGITSGSYALFITVNNSLQKQIPGIVSIFESKITTIPEVVKLKTGDVNKDNLVDLIDYQIITRTCYQEGEKLKKTKPDCQEHILADLNDDGIVGDIDINILQQAFASRTGDSINNPPQSQTPTPTTIFQN